MTRRPARLITIFSFRTALLSVALAAVSGASAADPEQLSAYASLKSVEGRMVSGLAASRVDALASAIGLGGEGRPVTDFSIQPEMGFSSNVNGGNPSKPLEVGSLVFHGDPNLFQKEGMIYGLTATQTARIYYGHGRYLDASLQGGYSHNFQHELGIRSFNANVCSINHISDWWFVDLCANKSISEKDLSRSESSTQSLTLSKFLDIGDTTHGELSIGASQTNNGSFTEKKISFGIQTLASTGKFSALNLDFGIPVAGKLTTKVALSGQVSTEIWNRTVNVSGSIERLEGGMLLGYERSDDRFSISAAFPIQNGVNASLGYMFNDSTIDYHDSSSPTFGISFTPKALSSILAF